jgi:hypothetical protein
MTDAEIKKALEQRDWHRICEQVARAAGRLQHEARLSPQTTEDHWEGHRRRMAQLFAELEAVMPKEGM